MNLFFTMAYNVFKQTVWNVNIAIDAELGLHYGISIPKWFQPQTKNTLTFDYGSHLSMNVRFRIDVVIFIECVSKKKDFRLLLDLIKYLNFESRRILRVLQPSFSLECIVLIQKL